LFHPAANTPFSACDLPQASALRPASSLYAAGANRQHRALKRSLDDRRRSVLLLLEALDEQGNKWSPEKVADYCDVSRTMVTGVIKAKQAREEQARRRQEQGGEPEMPPGLELLPLAPASQEEAEEDTRAAVAAQTRAVLRPRCVTC
jgi:hypothetical protein